MKTVIRKIIVLVIVLGGYTSYANELITAESHNNIIKRKYELSISNTKGQIVYSGKVNSVKNITSIFDFKKLKDGIYIIEVNKDFEIEMNSITVKNGIVTFLQDFKEKIFKPVFRPENTKLLISKLALGSGEMIVELYYENTLIHKERVQGKDILNRVYQLDETLRGTYKAIVRSDDRMYIENFRI